MGEGDDDTIAAVDAAVARHVGAGGVPGAAWAVARDRVRHLRAAGSADASGERPVRPDAIFRISSTSKPITAVGALVLVDDGTIALDDPIDDLLPELAGRRVIARPDGPLEDTVPATRPITVRDLLTFRCGWGFDFAATGPQTVLAAMAELDLGVGPPAPATHLPADEWLRRLGTLPLQHQPGERWLYHAGAEILGVLVARAAGRPLGEHLHERVFGPLGMVDTGFWVPEAARERLGPCFWSAEVPETDGAGGPQDGDRPVYDPTDGQWAAPPPFEDGGAGLVSTVGDLVTFGEALLGGGVRDGVRILSRQLVDEMTTNQLSEANLAVSGPDPTGAMGWGFGVAVQLRPIEGGLSTGSYGWDGGLGSSWAVDPATGTVGVLLTNQAWTSPARPPVAEDFWAAVAAALAG